MRKIKIARLLDTLRPRNMWDGVKKEQTNKETNKNIAQFFLRSLYYRQNMSLDGRLPVMHIGPLFFVLNIKPSKREPTTNTDYFLQGYHRILRNLRFDF